MQLLEFAGIPGRCGSVATASDLDPSGAQPHRVGWHADDAIVEALPGGEGEALFADRRGDHARALAVTDNAA